MQSFPRVCPFVATFIAYVNYLILSSLGVLYYSYLDVCSLQ